MSTLPTPNATALAYSQTLTQFIRQEIEAAGGYISFARYMELALYTPGLGYYSAGSYKFGKQGDFVTAPEISPLFAQCVAKQCQQILTALGSGDILELGAGSGKLAGDLLCTLEQLGCLPQHYFILEISGELRARQQQWLTSTCPHLLSRVTWLDRLPEIPIKGVIFANEVMDAMPVHCFQTDDNGIQERCVTIQHDLFDWQIMPPTTPALLQQIQAIQAIQEECPLPPGYRSEINLLLSSWIQTLALTLEQGIILLSDYGYGRREYYHPDRSTGTLMCYYQHHYHSDPFKLIGLQDITAHVDFTAVAENALAANLQVAGYTTQAAFLLASGILELAQQNTLSPADEYEQNQAIKLLTLPSQLGEAIKVISLSKNFDLPLLGFSLHDRRHHL
jgi:SAM-dependent MidA family methyltransferase